MTAEAERLAAAPPTRAEIREVSRQWTEYVAAATHRSEPWMADPASSVPPTPLPDPPLIMTAEWTTINDQSQIVSVTLRSEDNRPISAYALSTAAWSRLIRDERARRRKIDQEMAKIEVAANLLHTQLNSDTPLAYHARVRHPVAYPLFVFREIDWSVA